MKSDTCADPLAVADMLSAALELIDTATTDGPLTVVPTAALQKLEAAMDRLFDERQPTVREACVN